MITFGASNIFHYVVLKVFPLPLYRVKLCNSFVCFYQKNMQFITLVELLFLAVDSLSHVFSR